MRKPLSVSFVIVLLLVGLGAQSRPPLTRADFGQWETLSFPGRRAFSPDGAWLAYGINRANRNNEDRFRKLSDGTEKVVAFAGAPTFSSDSRWAGYSIGVSEAEQERRRAAREPVQDKLGLLNLTTGEATVVDAIQSFSFSGDGRYLAMRRYPPTPAGGAPPAAGNTGRGRGGATGSDEAAAPVGVTLIIRDLTSGRDTPFGNVSEYAWQDSESGHLVAMAISADGKAGNGVHVFDPASTVLRVLDSSATIYASLAWRKDSADLAVLRAKEDEGREGATEVVLAWRGLDTSSEHRAEFDPTSASSFPAGMRTVSYRRPSWSDDGQRLSIGITEWAEKPAQPARGRGAAGADPGGGDAAGRGGRGGRGAATPPVEDKVEPAGVDVWHWKDTIVMARQKLAAPGDRRRTLLAVWRPDDGRFVQIGQSFDEQISPIPHSTSALVEDGGPYAMDRSIGRPAADLSVVDLNTGARTRLKDRINDRFSSASPGGTFVLYVEGGHYWTIDLATGRQTNITKNVPTSFIDIESDQTSPDKPTFGVAGWTKGDAAVLLYDKFDVWLVPTGGSNPTRLTDGARDQVRHRIVRLDPDEDFIDLASPTYLALFGIRSKKSGYGILQDAAGSPAVNRTVWLDKSVGSLSKAPKADVLAYVTQDHDDSPDVFLTNASLGAAKQLTTTNPFQATYAWSRSEIVEYKSEKGLALQGALYYPAGYEPGKTYPMIVYVYETLSDNVHRYVAPSERDYYNTTVFTSQGYFVLQPDIVFRPREPGLSVVECVRPAVKGVVDRGLADAKRVGIVGHSWGGFDTAFLATNTTTFAAAVAGAAITDLVSNYGNHHWSSGIAETDHIETGQQRMVVPLYDDLQAYIRNSAIYNVPKMTTPLLLMTGDNDGTVFWHQAVSMYNIARRAKKNVVMIVYAGEDHGLRQARNQIDYQQRILAWFGHYLKGDEAPGWITDGQSFLAREAEVKKIGGGR